MSTTDDWNSVDEYFAQLLREDEALIAARASSADSHLPHADVAPNQGAFLAILAHAIGAKRVLEFGTLVGYSTIWLARAVGPSGHVDTLEIDPHNAAIAQANLERAGVADRVEIRIGAARDTAEQLIRGDTPDYDLAFIDADKPNNPHYLAAARHLVRTGGLIIIDNVVRGGAVTDAASDNPTVHGVRTLVDDIVDAGLQATAIQTVGLKGWDGFAIIRNS